MEELAENYCNKIYQECVDEAMYVPDVYQSKKDFIAGFSAQERIITDKINGLKSQLKQETQFKLTKTYNIEQIEKLKNQIEVLEQLIIK